MILYLDSSNLVKLYVEERGSAEIRRIVQEAEIVATSVVAYPLRTLESRSSSPVP